jgi:tRNA pseudouridine38-40 synthase
VYKYKLLISYDGTNYAGWQIQPNACSIQEVLQEKIQVILQEDVKIIGSGRTDTGVHALGQVAHFQSKHDLNLYRFQGSLNGLLPQDIRIREVETAPEDFQAQYSVKGKIYHYHLCLDQIQSPFKRLYSLHVLEKINLDLIYKAVPYFIGTHDFTSFTNQAHRGSAANDPVRTITRLDIVPEEGGIRLEFEGNGFLYKMVRNIVGTLLEIAEGKREVTDLPKIFEAKDRRLAGKAAPPQGLFLVKVIY